jgi:citrate synthase
MLLDPEQKIARPRQIYTGPKRRELKALSPKTAGQVVMK